jgi:hypothetical protein
MLANWNFKDEAANSTTQQINRQKSARTLEVFHFDPSVPRAVFFDHKRGTRHTATLSECDCSDFNLAGTNPRKTFKPCMHIYRLAIELGFIEAKYFDHRACFAAVGALGYDETGRLQWLLSQGHGNKDWFRLSQEETGRLQRLPSDPIQWGGWASEIHASGIQRNRQYRGYAIVRDEQGAICQVESGRTIQRYGVALDRCEFRNGVLTPYVFGIHGYRVALDRCECPDFLDRRLPCKHIYAAALASGIALPLSEAEYLTARNQGREIVFVFSADP